MNPYVGGETTEVEVKLNQNESPYNLPEPILAKIQERLANVKFNRYNEGSLKRLRELTAQMYGLDADQVMYGCGIDEIFYYIILTFVGKEEKIVRPTPSFAMYEICAQVAGAKDVPVALDTNFELTDEFIKQSKDAKLTFICRPNAQTGNSWDKKTIEQIVKNTKGIVCIDEAYAEFAQDDCLDLLKYENVILVRTFSKAYLAAGVRLGYALASKEVIAYMNRVRLPWNVGALPQVVGEVILENQQVFKEKVAEIKENRKELFEALKLRTKVLPTQTNFMSFKVSDPKGFCKTLKETGILVRNVSSYPGLEGYVRVTVGTKRENEQFLKAFDQVQFKPIDSIIFDVDGVLVDVSKSYREAIKLTVGQFRGTNATDEEIENIKKKPNSNNDWVVTYALATDYTGELSKLDRTNAKYLEMKEAFQKFYLDGLIDKEEIYMDKAYVRAILKKGLKIGVVTSRPRFEALYVLKRIGGFDEQFVMAQEDCTEEKPSPKPINELVAKMKVKNPAYIGDTINDRLAAERAGVRYEEVNKTQDVNDILKRLLK